MRSPSPERAAGSAGLERSSPRTGALGAGRAPSRGRDRQQAAAPLALHREGDGPSEKEMAQGESMPDITTTHAQLSREAKGVSESTVSAGTGALGPGLPGPCTESGLI